MIFLENYFTNKIVVSISIILSMIGSVNLFGQGNNESNARKYSNEFLNIGVGARALGMANAAVVSANDVTSNYWNPTGLLSIKSNLQAGVMHSQYFAGIAKYNFISIATPVDSNSTLGISLIHFGVDDIPNTTELIDSEGNIDYSKITKFSVADYGFLVSYARRLKTPGLSLGGNVKIVRRVAGDFARAWGYGFDLGLRYDKGTWNFGLMARDATTTRNFWSFNLSDEMKQTFAQTGNVIPVKSTEITIPKVLLGIAKTTTIKEKFHALVEVDLDLTFDGKRNVVFQGDPVSIDPHAGVELSYNHIIFLRGGINNIQKIKSDVGTRTVTTLQPNFGVGIALKKFALDYAFTSIGEQSVSLFSHVFSVKFDIYKQ